MDSGIASLSALPEELQLHILEILAVPGPPSKRNIREEPTLELTYSDATPLKNLSLVSSHWRRLVTPLLFTFVRLTPQVVPRQYTPGSSSDSGIEDYLRRLLADFVGFLTREHLADKAESIVINGYNFYGQWDVDLERTLYGVTNRFWSRILDALNPGRVVVVAPPGVLAGLVGYRLENDEHEWAFSSMPYHLLELSHDNSRSVRPTAFTTPGPSDTEARTTLDDTCILGQRPWTRVHLNEGSYLSAYAQYEYFERGPPTIVSTMCKRMATALSSTYYLLGTRLPLKLDLMAVKSFAYTAIFPFNAAFLSSLLTLVEELELQLSPDPQTGILDDKAKVGKADLTDCWSELRNAHMVVYDQMMYFPGEIKTRRLVIRDYLYPTVARELDAVLDPVKKHPGWAYLGDGVFERR